MRKRAPFVNGGHDHFLSAVFGAGRIDSRLNVTGGWSH
jgi:hypothetical protein